MTRPTRYLAAFALLAFIPACKKSNESAAPPPAPEPVSAPQTVADPTLPELKIEITGNDTFKFDINAIEAKPAQKVSVTLKNIGSMPKISMGHNFVLLNTDIDPAKFIEACMIHMASEFIAPELRKHVIASTKLLGPGESDTVTFVAPKTPGAYPYVCSFPGHFQIGMKGVLTVQ